MLCGEIAGACWSVTPAEQRALFSVRDSDRGRNLWSTKVCTHTCTHRSTQVCTLIHLLYIYSHMHMNTHTQHHTHTHTCAKVERATEEDPCSKPLATVGMHVHEGIFVYTHTQTQTYRACYEE